MIMSLNIDLISSSFRSAQIILLRDLSCLLKLIQNVSQLLLFIIIINYYYLIII